MKPSAVLITILMVVVLIANESLTCEKPDYLLVRPGERVVLSPIGGGIFESRHFIIDRNRLAGPEVQVLFHPAVDEWVERFSRGWRKRSLERGLQKLWLYEATMRRLFRRAGVPEEFIFLCLVESHGRVLSVSPRGAAGLWQIMPSTARYLGLKVNGIVDERYDPVKSTWAVARYLRKLYEKFGRWDLVLAAYNYGEYGVEDRVRRYGTGDFFRLLEFRAFPRETRAYVPKVLAAIRIGRSLLYRPLSERERLAIRAVETMRVTRPISLNDLSEILGLPLPMLMKLNPAVKNPYVNLPVGVLVHIPIGLRNLMFRTLWGYTVL